MEMKRAVVTAIAGCTFALGGGQALAQVDCATINTILAWQTAVSCDQADKTWTIGDTNLGGGIQVLFSNPGLSTHVMQIIGFDNSDLAGAWSIDYSITVTDPDFVISAMFAGADNPGFGSLLNKDVTGDGDDFSLLLTDGVEGPGSFMLGLNATTLNIAEDFSVFANSELLSVSNTFRQTRVEIPEPGTLALMGMALAGVALVRRRRN